MALARTLMTPSDVVLLDDVLIAVDVHVATALVQDALLGTLKENTRVTWGRFESSLPNNIHRWEVISPTKIRDLDLFISGSHMGGISHHTCLDISM